MATNVAIRRPDRREADMSKKRLSLLPLLCVLLLAPVARAATGDAGQWHFDEGWGTVAHDSSGNENDGTLQGAAKWVPGKFGTALSFDGATAAVHVPRSLSLEPAPAVSVTAWVKATSPGNFKYIVAKGANGCLAASYGLYTGPNGGIIFYVSHNSGTSWTRSPDGGHAVWDGNWHFIAGTDDGSVVRLYVDGKQVGTGTPDSGAISYGLANGSDLFIGHYPGCTGLDFAGAIDEPNVWARALSATDVQTAMQCPAYGAPIVVCVVVRL
jgi:hypothetical protein